MTTNTNDILSSCRILEYHSASLHKVIWHPHKSISIQVIHPVNMPTQLLPGGNIHSRFPSCTYYVIWNNTNPLASALDVLHWSTEPLISHVVWVDDIDITWSSVSALDELLFIEALQHSSVPKGMSGRYCNSPMFWKNRYFPYQTTTTTCHLIGLSGNNAFLF